MSDDEREARMRGWGSHTNLEGDEVAFLWERLDAARLALSGAEADRDRLRECAADLPFDLQWKADQRAIKEWQGAHPGNDLVWPDRCSMVVWLLDQLDAATATFDDLEAATATDTADVISLRAEIAGLRAPPGADVMELASNVLARCPMTHVDGCPITEVARALSQHGSSEYARAIGEAAQVANAVAHRAADNAGRIKEANPGLTLDKLREIDHQLAGQRHAAVEIEQGIRALSSQPASDDAVYRR